MTNVAKLTIGRIGALVPEEKDYILYEDATPGFGVRIYPTGQRRYVFRYRAGNSRGAPTRMVTIADARKVGLEDARRIARELAGKVARGDDPSKAKRQAEAERARARTFGEVRDEFLTKHVDARLRVRSAAEYRRVLQKEFRAIEGKAFAEVTRADISGALQAIAGRGKVRSSNLARAYVRKLFSWAQASGLCETNPVADTARAGPDARRERVLSREELGDIYRAAVASGDTFGALVRFLMLTGQRRGEVFEMTDAEIDEDGRIWTLPGTRTKNKRVHEVPLCETCLRIMAARPRYSNLAFSTRHGTVFGYADKAKKNLDKSITAMRREANPKAKPLPHWTLHDLRRSFVTHAHGELGVPLPVLERAINHVSGSFGGVVGIYNRAPLLKERIAAFGEWEAYVLAAAGLERGHPEPPAKGEAA